MHSMLGARISGDRVTVGLIFRLIIGELAVTITVKNAQSCDRDRDRDRGSSCSKLN